MTFVTFPRPSVAPMVSRRLERRLRKVGDRLRELRTDLATVDAQLAQLAEEADDLALRALMSDAPFDAAESRNAGRHADAMARHRQHVLAEIAEREAEQDRLLDQLSG